MAPSNCTYRRQTTPCTNQNIMIGGKCDLCLQGQLADSIELQTSAIANLTASIEERKIA